MSKLRAGPDRESELRAPRSYEMTPRRVALCGIAVALSLVLGCTGKAPAAAQPTDPEWCAEHSRPEAQCLPCKVASNQCSDEAPACGATK